MTPSFDPFDELAAMFLTAPQPQPPQAATLAAPPPARPDPTNRVATELLIAGNLPVRGGLWLTPYADAIARQQGAMALLRLDGEQPSLLLLRAPARLGNASLPASLEQAIETVGQAVDGWIVRPSSSTAMVDLVRCRPSRITMLTSADEAAVVAVYQVIKDLAEAAEAAQETLPAVGLAIVGADQNTALGVIERLNRTTVSFLGVEVRLAMCLPRMDAGIRSTRYATFSDPVSTPLVEVMTWIDAARQRPEFEQPSQGADVAGQIFPGRGEIDILNPPRMAAAPPPPPPVLPLRAAASVFAPAAFASRAFAPPAGAPAKVEAVRQAHTATVDRSHAPGSRSDPAGGDQSRASVTSPSPAADALPIEQVIHPQPTITAVKLAPKPSMDIEAKSAQRAVEPDEHGRPVPLANHVVGLAALPVRAPGHEGVEIAVDAAGRLHLLGREHALRDMRIVEAWAIKHRELIALACPHHRVDAACKVVCHVFTAEPAAVADLHGTDLRLHVLAPVVVDGKTGWYVAPLSPDHR